MMSRSGKLARKYWNVRWSRPGYGGVRMRFGRYMSRTNLTCALLLSAFAFATFGQRPDRVQTSEKDSSSLNAKADIYMKPIMEINGFTGFIMVVKGGKVLLSRGYGMANYELGVLNTSQTKFHLASLSKTFTAAAIMLLDERGL